ncbi:MAG: SdrD B-like domain-containing protein [Verrucomicrobiales bacterium]
MKGELDPVFSRYPDVGLTVPGGQADYELRVTNTGQVAMDTIKVIDILPHIGDRGVIDTSLRGSQWQPYLVGAVSAPAGVTVYYSTSKNPCRDELTPGVPSGCEPPNWTTTPPANITTVGSLKFDFGSTILMPGDEVVLGWPMRAPLNAPTGGQVAWSSFGFIANRMDDNSQMLPAEPIKVGIMTQAADPPYYGDFVWHDLDRDGIQDSGEPGVNGIRVELYEDNGDGVPDPATDSLVDFTVTNYDGAADGAYLFTNLYPGDFFGVVYLPAQTLLSPQGVGSPNKDSDGVFRMVNGRPAAVFPITNLKAPEIDRSWDQGLIDAAGLPAVWAMDEDGAGRIVIGGKFARSHGMPRNNIARLMADGKLDQSFDPGSGTNGEVYSVAVLGDGRVAVGGAFTTYDGIGSRGIAVTDIDGGWIGPFAQPSEGYVRGVADAGDGGVLIAGTFSNVGGQARRGIAKLLSDGSLDASFPNGGGVDGAVYAVAVQDDGKIVIGGAFGNVHGTARRNVARLTPTAASTHRSPGNGASGPVYSVRLEEGGTIVVAGEFDACAGRPAKGVMRLLDDGAPDPTFGESTLTVEEMRASQ